MAAPTELASSLATAAANSSTPSVTPGATPSAGDVVWVCYAWNQNTLDLTVDTPTGYTLAVSTVRTQDLGVALYYRVWQAGDTLAAIATTIRNAGTATSRNWSAITWVDRGASSSPVGVNATGVSSAGGNLVGRTGLTATATGPDRRALGLIAHKGNDTMSVDNTNAVPASGWTLETQVGSGTATGAASIHLALVTQALATAQQAEGRVSWLTNAHTSIGLIVQEPPSGGVSQDISFSSAGVGASTFGLAALDNLSFSSAGVGASSFAASALANLSFGSAGTSTTTATLGALVTLSFASAGVGATSMLPSALVGMTWGDSGSSSDAADLHAMVGLAMASSGVGSTTFDLHNVPPYQSFTAIDQPGVVVTLDAPGSAQPVFDPPAGRGAE